MKNFLIVLVLLGIGVVFIAPAFVKDRSTQQIEDSADQLKKMREETNQQKKSP